MTLTLQTLLLAFLLTTICCGAGAEDAKPLSSQDRLISSIDLSRSFDAKPGFRFTALQGPDTPGLAMTDPVPGRIRLCVSRDGGASCSPDLDSVLRLSSGGDEYSVPHYLIGARVVHAGDTRPLLLIQVASQPSLDGDQRVGTVVLAYDQKQERFTSVYEKRTNKNNDQEVRYVTDGPLTGAIISAEPTSDAPFGFWITINRLGPTDGYKRVLRYRSATRYGDGNPLAVIDSEMPEILKRLGLWRPGTKLPHPPGECAKPHLIRQELWC